MKKLSALGISFFILLIVARLPFGRVIAVSYVIDEYGRVSLVNAYGQVLGDESTGMMMPPSGGGQMQPSSPPPSGGGGEQHPQESSSGQQPQQQQQQSQPQPQTQPQTQPQQQPSQQPQGQPQPQQMQQQGDRSGQYPSMNQQQMQQYQNMQQYGSSNGQQGRTSESSQGQLGQQTQSRPSMTAANERMKAEFEQRFQNASPQQQEQMKKDMERMRISAKNGQLKAEGPGIGGSASGANQGQFNQGQFKNGSPGASQFGQSGGARFNSFGAGANIDSIKVKESAEKNTVEIKARGNEMELNQQGVRARTAFPISVGANNQLIVTTPNGQQQTVTVLPNEAIKELMKNGIVTGFAGSPTGTPGTVPVPTGTSAAGGVREQGTPTSTGNATNLQQDVELTQENGKLEYKVTGTKEAKFLGLYPVQAQVEAHVSASTGATTSITQPWYFSSFGFLFR